MKFQLSILIEARDAILNSLHIFDLILNTHDSDLKPCFNSDPDSKLLEVTHLSEDLSEKFFPYISEKKIV